MRGRSVFRKENFTSNFISFGIRVGSNQVAGVGKKMESLKELEEIKMYLLMENVELRRMLEGSKSKG